MVDDTIADGKITERFSQKTGEFGVRQIVMGAIILMHGIVYPFLGICSDETRPLPQARGNNEVPRITGRFEDCRIGIGSPNIDRNGYWLKFSLRIG